MSSLLFNRIRICSEAEQAALELPFHPRKNLLWGGNGAGKSVILKSLFRAFDAEPRGEIPHWDYSAIVAVDFTVAGRQLTAVRADGLRALFEGDTLLIAATSSVEWNAGFARTVGFELKLLDRTGRFREAGPSNLFLPFFLSQDAFDSGWETFSGLKQFQRPIEHTLEYFARIRPPRYFELKADEEGQKVRANELRVELGTLQRTRARIRKNLKVSPIKLSAQDFQAEIRELVARSQALAKKQDELRQAIVEDQTLEHTLAEQVRLSNAALKEHEADFKVAAELNAEGRKFVCPTCRAEHDSSFHTFLGLAEDARELLSLKRSVEKSQEGVRFRLERNRRKAAELREEYGRLQQLLSVKRGKFTFDEFIKNYSAGAADAQIAGEERLIERHLDEVASRLSEIKADLKNIRDTHDSGAVLARFREHLTSAVVGLNVDGLKSLEKWPITKKPENSGSRYARGIVAYYVALWKTIEVDGVLPTPVVIDSPNQGAQDRENLQALLTLLGANAPANTQVILSHEREPEEYPADKSVNLVKGERLLTSDAFQRVAPQMLQYLEVARARLARIGQSSPDPEPADDE